MLGELPKDTERWRQKMETRIHLNCLLRTSTISLPGAFSWYFKRKKYSSSLERINDTLFPVFQSFVFPCCFDPSCQNGLICLSGQRHHHTLCQVLPYFQNDTHLSQNLPDSKWHIIGYILSI